MQWVLHRQFPLVRILLHSISTSTNFTNKSENLYQWKSYKWKTYQLGTPCICEQSSLILSLNKDFFLESVYKKNLISSSILRFVATYWKGTWFVQDDQIFRQMNYVYGLGQNRSLMPAITKQDNVCLHDDSMPASMFRIIYDTMG